MVAPITDITAIFRDILRDSEIELAPSTRFDDLVGWDSMDLISIVVEVECHFDLQFELTEIDRMTNIGDLLRMIEVKRALAAA